MASRDRKGGNRDADPGSYGNRGGARGGSQYGQHGPSPHPQGGGKSGDEFESWRAGRSGGQGQNTVDTKTK